MELMAPFHREPNRLLAPIISPEPVGESDDPEKPRLYWRGDRTANRYPRRLDERRLLPRRPCQPGRLLDVSVDVAPSRLPTNDFASANGCEEIAENDCWRMKA